MILLPKDKLRSKANQTLLPSDEFIWIPLCGLKLGLTWLCSQKHGLPEHSGHVGLLSAGTGPRLWEQYICFLVSPITYISLKRIHFKFNLHILNTHYLSWVPRWSDFTYGLLHKYVQGIVVIGELGLQNGKETLIAIQKGSCDSRGIEGWCSTGVGGGGH